MNDALLIHAAGEADADLYYAARFLTADPVTFLRVGRKSMLLLNDLELGRGRLESSVDEVLSLSELTKRAGKGAGLARVIAGVLRDRGVSRCLVPPTFPLEMAEALRKQRLRLKVKPAPFFEGRVRKTPAEVRAIERTQRAVEDSLEAALEVLRRSKIRGHQLVHRGGILTSEFLRGVIEVALLERGCAAAGTIVASGDHGCNPHDRGSGPIRPDRTLVIDIFPRSTGTRYFADMTRTVVKGKVSPAVRRQYEAVREAQEAAIALVRPGVDGRVVHREVQKTFERLGYKTGPRGGRMEGFFHGTGHGVGLDVHEAPRLSVRGDVLKAGAVVTVEPGLYYFGTGAVRLEDMVLVTPGGCRNLTRSPKVLQV